MPYFRRILNIRTALRTLSLPVLALSLLACQGENPASPPVEKPTDLGQILVDSADGLYAGGKYADAMGIYTLAIAVDSTTSRAYQGYILATLRFYDVTLADLQLEMQENWSQVANHPDSVLNKRLQVFLHVLPVMERFRDRDTLSRMDGKVKSQDLQGEFLMLKLSYTILNLYDLEPKGIFDAHDRIMTDLLENKDGLGNFTDLAEQMKTDTILQNQVNQKLLQLQSGLGDISQLLTYITGDSTLGPPSSEPLDGTTAFYQFGDHLDNDGDGCVDEEIVDSLDNDLDGFIDEDARLITGNGILVGPNSTGPADGVDNDRNGSKDAADAGENKLGGFTAAKDVLTFVILSSQQDNWVKIKKDASNMDVRIRIQKDSLAVRLTPGVRPVPAAYQAKLDSAKTLVGGCWRNY